MISLHLVNIESQTLKFVLLDASCLSLNFADNDILAEAEGWLFERVIGFDELAFDTSSRLFRGGLSGVIDLDLCLWWQSVTLLGSL